MKTYSFPWGNETLNLALPQEWQVLGELQPQARPPAPDVCAAAERALAQPIGSRRLSELARPGQRVALVVDDGSRPTPIAQLLPPVLAELQRGGISLQDVTVIPALGLHRPMDEAEVAARLGGNWLAQMRWQSHACDDPQRLAYLGQTRRGSPVWVNRTVAEADLILSIGCIEPHIIASFGGGYKNLFPGVAGRAMIAHNHSLNCRPATFNMVGQPIEENPMRLDLEEAGQMLKPPVFLVNAVLNSALQVVEIVSGDPIQAHRAGAAISASLYGVPIPQIGRASCRERV